MKDAMFLVLRAVLVTIFFALVCGQVLLLVQGAVAFRASDFAFVAIAAGVIVFLGAIAVQGAIVGIWRLLTMVRRDSIFSREAFRYVDLVSGSVVAASGLACMLGVLAGVVARKNGDLAPGAVLLVFVVALVGVAVTLIVHVLRMLLARAVERDGEARVVQAELDEVV